MTSAAHMLEGSGGAFSRKIEMIDAIWCVIDEYFGKILS